MSRFIGKVFCKIDDKGRFLFPSKFYMLLPGYDLELPEIELVIRKNDKLDCFTLYPKNFFEKMEDEVISQLNPLIDSDIDAMTSFYESVEELLLDKQKRFKIPLSIRSVFSSNEVVLVGIGQFLQIWDKEVFEARQVENKKNGGLLSNRLEAMRDLKNGKGNLN